MEYSTDRNYISEGNGQGPPMATNQFGAPNASSAFSATSTLGGLNPQFQQRRQNNLAFDQSNVQHNQNYNNGIMSESYGSLQLGTYEGNTIMDWNNGSRALGGIDAQFGITQANGGLFQQSASNPNDWASGLRGVPQDSLGLQLTNNNNPTSYNLNDLTQLHTQQLGLGTNGANITGGGGNNLQNRNPPGPGGGNPRYNNMQGGGPGGPNNNNPNTRQPPGQQQPQQQQQQPPFNNNLSPAMAAAAAANNVPGTGGSNAQGRALNRMLLDILRDRAVDPNRLAMAIDTNIERMDCVNLATLLFHTGKKRLLLTPSFIKRIAVRFSSLKEELRAREASNALYGLKCMSSEIPEVRQLVFALASKLSVSQTELVAQAVGNALYGCQMMTSEHEEVRYLLHMLSIKIANCNELLEAQNVGNALYGLRGMSSDCKEVRMLITAITPKIATAREELNGQALGNSLYGLQGMNSREPEVRNLLSVLAAKVSRTWEDLKAQEVGNALYGLKRMNSDISEVRHLIEALVPKVASSPEILDAQAIGNSFYGMQNMKSDNTPVLSLLSTMADKVMLSPAELDGQAMGNSLYGLQGMKSDKPEVRAVVNAITMKIQASCLEMNAQELGNALYGLQNMTCDYVEVRRLLGALHQKVSSSKHELTSQEIGNAIFGLQGMRSDCREVRLLVRQIAIKIQQSSSLIDPQGIANSLFGMQRMSSESEEIKALIASLTVKIEQSWKVLSPQHVSNSLFGLQNLCSIEPEVRGLVHALVPKILAARDVMSPKQICIALYGLKNMFSIHDEARSILGPLTAKLSEVTEPISLQLLSLAFYGMQGMDSTYEEVRGLLIGLCEKLANVDEIDAFSVANIIFGLQRMNSSFIEVQNALELISPMVMTLADAGLEIGAQVCSTLIYGLQNCSCQEESVRRILFVAMTFAKGLIGNFTQQSATTATASTTTNTDNTLQEAICIHQALSLSLQVLPGLQLDNDLYTEMKTQQQLVYTYIESRKVDLPPYKLSVAEKRLADSIADVLADEPFVVTTGELLHGYDACITIRLRPGITLTTKEGLVWNPVLNIEVSGPRDSTPRYELFSRLRAQYLLQEMGVIVQTIPYTSIAGQSRASLRESLRRSNDLFQALCPPSVEDATTFNSILMASGVIKSDILSTLSSETRLNVDNPLSADSGSSFFSLNNGDNIVGNGLDDFDPIPADENIDFFETTRNSGSTTTAINRPYRPYIGMAIGWIGDQPVVTISPHSTPRTSPTMNYSSNPNYHRRSSPSANKGYKTVSQLPMPPGHSSRTVYPPLIEIGPPSTMGVALGNGPMIMPPQQAPMPPMPNNNNPRHNGSRNHHGGYRQGGGGGGGDRHRQPHGPPNGMGGPPGGEMDGSRIVMDQSGGNRGIIHATTEDGTENTTGEVVENTEVDSEIAYLEAQLEIKRLEAKLLQLKKKTGPTTPSGATPVGSTGSGVKPSTQHSPGATGSGEGSINGETSSS